MAYNYVVTAHKPTAVNHCAIGNVTSPDDLNLVVIRCNRLQLFVVSPEGLVPIKEVGIHGVISVMKIFRYPGTNNDLIFLLTNNYDAMILECVRDDKSFEVITRTQGNVSDRIGKPSEHGPMGIVDPEARCIALRLYDGILKIIPLEKGSQELKAYNIRIDELTIQDMDFLYGCKNPTLVEIYQDLKGRHVKTHEISLKEKEFIKDPWEQDNIESEAGIVIPVCEPLCGVVIVGLESITYLNGSNVINVSPPILRTSTCVCYARVDERGERYLIGNMAGRLMMLVLVVSHGHPPRSTDSQPGEPMDLDLEGEGGATTEPCPQSAVVCDVRVETLGTTCIPECITYLDNGVVFVGSRLGDSQLIRLCTECQPATGEYLRVLESYPSLAPIVDMQVVDLERQGQDQIVTCSGAFKDGSLRIIRNGIGIQEMASIDLQGIRGMWSISSTSDAGQDTNNYIVVTFVLDTRVLSIEDEEVEEREFSGFCSDQHTLFCANIGDCRVVQITTVSARLIHFDSREAAHRFGSLVCEWTPPDGASITVGYATSTHVVCAVGATLYCLHAPSARAPDTGAAAFLLKSRADIRNEVAAICVSADLVAVALWTHISAVVLALPDLRTLCAESLACEIVPRSLLIVNLDFTDYCMIGLGDGTLIYYNIDLKSGRLSEKRQVTLGTQPTVLTSFKSCTVTNVFACSDRPTIIYSSNRKLVFSNVNLREVTHMCYLNTAAYPSSLAFCSETTITIGTVDEIQKLHIRTIPLQESPRRICYQQSSQSFAVLSMRLDVFENNAVTPVRVSASTQARTTSNYLNILSFNNIQQKQITQPPQSFQHGQEVEVHSVLIFDQHTLEVVHAHTLAYTEYALSCLSISFDGDPLEYYVVGTAYVNPEEAEAKQGRIIVFHYSEMKLTHISEKEIKGACYCLANLNGKLLAAVNSTVRLFEWTCEKELRLECSSFNNIVSIYVKTKGDFVLVGDLMRSITLLQYKSMEGTFEEIARDYSTKYMTAIEIIDDDVFLGAESNNNLFVCQKDVSTSTDEERAEMREIGRYHLGDMVNVFRKGALAMQGISDRCLPISHSVLFGTVHGAIGLLIQIDSIDMFKFLERLQNRMSACLYSVGGIDQTKWRAFKSERRQEACEGFLDGDLIESFLELNTQQMQHVVADLKIKGNSEKLRDATVADIINVSEELTRLH